MRRIRPEKGMFNDAGRMGPRTSPIRPLQGFTQIGVALLVAMITMALTFALVIGFMELATTDIRIAENQLRFTQSMCAADAGIEEALAQMQEKWKWNPPNQPVQFCDDPPAYYTVEVARVSGSFADVSALGECRGVRARVSAKVRLFPERQEIVIVSWTDRETLSGP